MAPEALVLKASGQRQPLRLSLRLLGLLGLVWHLTTIQPPFDPKGLMPDQLQKMAFNGDKGSLDSAVPVDPLIYRFHEITQVYGTTIKALIHEMFGDGIGYYHLHVLRCIPAATLSRQVRFL